ETVTVANDVVFTGKERQMLTLRASSAVVGTADLGSDDPITVATVNGSAANVGTQITLASGAHLTLNADGSYSYDPSTITGIENRSEERRVGKESTTAKDRHRDQKNNDTCHISVQI